MIFGQDITSDDIIDQMSFFDNWEDKYSFIIDLGKQLPVCEDCHCIDKNEVKGCQSQVWISPCENSEGKIVFRGNSDAVIVKGLLAIILSAYNCKTKAEILAFDIENYFSQLNLLNHLSPTRGNGVRAMVEKIREFAQS